MMEGSHTACLVRQVRHVTVVVVVVVVLLLLLLTG
jgi:hypothetical protein